MGADQRNGRLQRLLRRQYGLVTRDQLAQVGLSRSALRWRLHSLRWRALLPGVYLTSGGPPTRKQVCIAAVLYAGPGAQLTGASALELHSVRYRPDDRYVRVLAPLSRQVRSTGFVRVHRTAALDSRPVGLGPVLMCGVARAVAEAARRCADLRAVRALVAEVVQRELTDLASLREELERGSRANSALLRRAIEEVAEGTRSAPEAELRELLSTSTVLPRLMWNPRLVAADGARLPTPDGWIEEVALALEVDSREHHLCPADWRRTMDRHNRLAEHGAMVLHFPPSQIRQRPAHVLRTVERSYLARLRAGVHSGIRVIRTAA